MNQYKKIKICFIADKHSLYDDRIYWKMAVPLKNKGYDVYYLLIRDENKSGITNEGIKYEVFKTKTFSSNKYINFILKNLNVNNNYRLLFNKAKELKTDIYHFHDLWINKIGKKLKYLDHKPAVFYDAREPYAEDYISYSKETGILKKAIYIFSSLVDKWEKNQAKYYDLVISNEEIVRDKFRKKLGKEKAEVLYNFTNIYNDYDDRSIEQKEYDFIYCGGVTKLRGVFKIIEAVLIAKEKLPNIKLAFVGEYSPKKLKYDLQKFVIDNNLDQNVFLFSKVNYSKIKEFYNNSKVGLVTLLPVKTFKISMPIKIFEYMAFGLPIIGSDFGHIKKYIEKDNCGITVNPDSSDEIANTMVKLMTNNKLLNYYSNNGRKATLEKYKWDFEFERLLSFYTKALNERKK